MLTLYTDQTISENDTKWDRVLKNGGYYVICDKRIPYILVFPLVGMWDGIKAIPGAFIDGIKSGWKSK